MVSQVQHLLDAFYATQIKHCYQCKQDKTFNDFYKNRSHSDGLASQCKDCHKENNNHMRNNKEYYERMKHKLGEKIKCPCGGQYRRDSKSKHLTYKIHQNYLASLQS